MSKDTGRQRTLADLIVDKIKQSDAQVSSGFIYLFSFSGCLFVKCSSFNVLIYVRRFGLLTGPKDSWVFLGIYGQ